jgi:hypothetical protein
MADDLKQFFAEDMGTIEDADRCQWLLRRRNVEGFQADKQ